MPIQAEKPVAPPFAKALKSGAKALKSGAKGGKSDLVSVWVLLV